MKLSFDKARTLSGVAAVGSCWLISACGPEGHSAGEAARRGEFGQPNFGAGGSQVVSADWPEIELDGSAELVDCTIETSLSQSEQISTVFRVSFTSDLTGARGASVRFGKLDEGFQLEARLEQRLLNGASSALLLGMASSSDYKAQVVVRSDDEICVSEIMTLSTGGFPGGSGLTNASITDEGPSSSQVERGFVVSSTGVGKGRYVYIVNHLGEVVWWYPTPFSEVTRARMSYDGKYMYARNLNLARGPGGILLKVAMDGTGEEVINLPASHHDFAVAPGNTVLYIAGYGDCDAIFQYPGDAEKALFDVNVAFPTYAGTGGLGDENCHTNAIQYNHFDKTVTLSDANHNALVNFDYETGDLNWVYGGSTDSSFEGDVTWERQHGLHMTDSNTLYFFNNGNFPSGPSTIYRARLSDGFATWDFSYRSKSNSLTLGDVQELPGGNVLVGYSSSGGILHEVDSNGVLIRAMSLPFANSGYINHRSTLYGRPPR